MNQRFAACLFAFSLLFPGLASGASFLIQDVIIEGNRVYSREKIFEILQITPGKSYQSEYIKSQINKLMAQYETDGYTLVTLENILIDLESRLIITINEGVIVEMYIRGTGIRTLFQLRQDINILPGETFNSIRLKQSLNLLKKKYGYRDITVDVVPIPERKGYFHLFIYVSSFISDRGLSLGITTASGPTIKTTIGWQQRDFFGKSTQYKLDASLYVWNTGIRSQEYTFEYIFPISDVIRPLIGGFYGVNGMGRADLGLSFKQQITSIIAGIQFKIKHWFHINFKYESIFPVYFERAGTDIENKYLQLHTYDKRNDKFELQFRFTDEAMTERSDLRSFILLQLVYHKHKIWDSSFKAILSAKKVFTFGYNYLILETRMVNIFGRAPFIYEEPVSGHYLKGYTHGLVNSDRIFQISGEYRFSLYKDYIHLCWVTQSSWFRKINPSGYRIYNNNLTSFGPGLYFHFKEFAGYIYYSIGLRERADKGEYHFALVKVF